MEILGFVIVCKKDNDRTSYYSTDQIGNPYWATTIKLAEIFSLEHDAKQILEGKDFTREINFSDGYIYPPNMIHSASDVSFYNPKGKINIYIQPLLLGNISFEREINVEIKKVKS